MNANVPITLRIAILAGLLAFLLVLSYPKSKPKIWQSGTLTKIDPLLPPGKTPTELKCSLLVSEFVYTVDTDTYQYQFMGSSLAYPQLGHSSTINFLIEDSGAVNVREANHKNHYIYLKLFRKFAKPGTTSTTPTSQDFKVKRREWVSASVVNAQPSLFDPMMVNVLSLPGTAPCVFMPISREYSVKTANSSFLLLWRNLTPINITINGASRLAMGKHRLAYLVDDIGKERRLEMIRPPNSPSTPNQNLVTSVK